MVKHVRTDDLEQIARRVWYAKRNKATRYADDSKCSSFETMGFQSMNTEFPMRQDEWTSAGSLEIKITYPKWDIPGYIFVRKPTMKRAS